MSERSLGEAPEQPEEQPELDPAGYDIADYAGGIRPGRRRVTIQPRPDLYPDLQRLIERIDEAPEDANVDDLIDEFDRLRDLMRVEWVLERRSPEWTVEFYRQAARDMGVEVKNGAHDVARADFTEEQAAEVGMRCILAQTVETSDGHDWTLEDMRRLREVAPEQVDVLADAVAKVNAGHAEALTLDFSRRRSTSRGTRRSYSS